MKERKPDTQILLKQLEHRTLMEWYNKSVWVTHLTSFKNKPDIQQLIQTEYFWTNKQTSIIFL